MHQQALVVCTYTTFAWTLLQFGSVVFPLSRCRWWTTTGARGSLTDLRLKPSENRLSASIDSCFYHLTLSPLMERRALVECVRKSVSVCSWNSQGARRFNCSHNRSNTTELKEVAVSYLTDQSCFVNLYGGDGERLLRNNGTNWPLFFCSQGISVTNDKVAGIQAVITMIISNTTGFHLLNRDISELKESDLFYSKALHK